MLDILSIRQLNYKVDSSVNPTYHSGHAILDSRGQTFDNHRQILISHFIPYRRSKEGWRGESTLLVILTLE